MKFRSIIEFYDSLPKDEMIIVDILRNLIKENLPPGSKEKFAFNVPYFYGKRGICIIWPASVKGGGVKEGVLLGFMYGFKLADVDKYLSSGTNKKIFYRIFTEPQQIDELAIKTLLAEAVIKDQ